MIQLPMRLSLLLCILVLPVFGEQVSYYREVVPIFKRSCNGCHHPGKLKGDLDLTTHAAILKGGKHGPILNTDGPGKSPSQLQTDRSVC